MDKDNQKPVNGRDLFSRWSELIRLSDGNIKDCLHLQVKMFARMRNKPHSYDYIRYRDADGFKKMIDNGELFGVFNRDDALCGMVSIVNCSKEELHRYLVYEGGTFFIPDNLKKVIFSTRAIYLYNWMSDLNPINYGLGQHMADKTMSYIKDELFADFCISSVHVNNVAAHQKITKKFNSFIGAVKSMNITNINKENKDTPVFYIISIVGNRLSEWYDANLDKNVKFEEINLKQIIEEQLNPDKAKIIAIKSGRFYKTSFIQ